MTLQIKENPKTRHAKAVEAADQRILEMIDSEITAIHPAWRQCAKSAIRFMSRESDLLKGDKKDEVLKDLQRFNGLVMWDESQADSIEKALSMSIRMYRLRKHEIDRLSKGFSPRLLIDRKEPKEPEVKNRKRKKPALKLVQ